VDEEEILTDWGCGQMIVKSGYFEDCTISWLRKWTQSGKWTIRENENLKTVQSLLTAQEKKTTSDMHQAMAVGEKKKAEKYFKVLTRCQKKLALINARLEEL
jgi:hypothetical protein